MCPAAIRSAPPAGGVAYPRGPQQTRSQWAPTDGSAALLGDTLLGCAADRRSALTAHRTTLHGTPERPTDAQADPRPTRASVRPQACEESHRTADHPAAARPLDRSPPCSPSWRSLWRRPVPGPAPARTTPATGGAGSGLTTVRAAGGHGGLAAGAQHAHLHAHELRRGLSPARLNGATGSLKSDLTVAKKTACCREMTKGKFDLRAGDRARRSRQAERGQLQRARVGLRATRFLTPASARSPRPPASRSP